MSRMIRKQVCIEEEQDALLKQRACELGVTESRLIREGIKSHRGNAQEVVSRPAVVAGGAGVHALASGTCDR
jgi:hypothetical protein